MIYINTVTHNIAQYMFRKVQYNEPSREHDGMCGRGRGRGETNV